MMVGRFQVMATLQAARVYVLNLLPLESAKSFGLNRAIFYAAAKKGFKKIQKPVELKPEYKRKYKKELKIEQFKVGDEMAFCVEIEGKKYFTIGGEIQTEKDFERQIEKRFGGKFDKAWEEAVKICREAGEDVLKSQRLFYEKVYKPRRDELAQKWSNL